MATKVHIDQLIDAIEAREIDSVADSILRYLRQVDDSVYAPFLIRTLLENDPTERYRNELRSLLKTRPSIRMYLGYVQLFPEDDAILDSVQDFLLAQIPLFHPNADSLLALALTHGPTPALRDYALKFLSFEQSLTVLKALERSGVPVRDHYYLSGVFNDERRVGVLMTWMKHAPFPAVIAVAKKFIKARPRSMQAEHLLYDLLDHKCLRNPTPVIRRQLHHFRYDSDLQFAIEHYVRSYGRTKSGLRLIKDWLLPDDFLISFSDVHLQYKIVRKWLIEHVDKSNRPIEKYRADHVSRIIELNSKRMDDFAIRWLKCQPLEKRGDVLKELIRRRPNDTAIQSMTHDYLRSCERERDWVFVAIAAVEKGMKEYLPALRQRANNRKYQDILPIHSAILQHEPYQPSIDFMVKELRSTQKILREERQRLYTGWESACYVNLLKYTPSEEIASQARKWLRDGFGRKRSRAAVQKALIEYERYNPHRPAEV